MEDTKFEASWNLAEAIILDMASHIVEGRNAFLQGRLSKYYWHFNINIRTIFPFLDDNEVYEIYSLEDQIEGIVDTTNKEKYKQLAVYLKTYDALSMAALKKYNFLVPPKKDRTRLIG